MASLARRLATNVEGELFVDESCIDCAACRWIAPESFDARAGQSRVHAQPATPMSRARAAEALLSCPTGSIGVAGEAPGLRAALRTAAAAFPRPFAPRVLHCGYHNEATLARRAGCSCAAKATCWSTCRASASRSCAGSRSSAA